jgi:Flp pilus assembly protein CpaB
MRSSAERLSLTLPPGHSRAKIAIEPEMRALIRPGDRVDVMSTRDSGTARQASVVLLTNVFVLSVSHGAPSPDAIRNGSRPWISVALTEDELYRLRLASTKSENLTVILTGLGGKRLPPVTYIPGFQKLFR